ncbi:MAG: hypothetical protein A4E66_01419 [Syntrophus sp. PtaB.Bin001]|nr:MAG: hypothetical protein A4E66_01419 [Syntrophus sp. PtaB.Bin001]
MKVTIIPDASHDIHSQCPEKIVEALKRALSGSDATTLSSVKKGNDS